MALSDRPSRKFVSCVSLALLLMLLTARSAPGQTPAAARLSGRTLDQLQRPVAGATVTVLAAGDRPLGEATSDAHGTFTIDRVPQGRYRVRAAAPGFEPATADLIVGASGPAALDLTLRIGVQQDVIVVANAEETPAAQVAAPVGVVDRDAIDRLGAVELVTALRAAPNTQITQSGAPGSIASVFVRGGAASFNKVLVDGVEANEIGGRFNFADLATAGVDRVEVLRTANSVIYGSDALSGVVSLTTRRGTSRVPEFSYTADGGSFHTSNQTASFGGASGRADYFLSVSHLGTDNQIPNNQYRLTSYAGRVDTTLGRTEMTATLRESDSRFGIPNSPDFFGIQDDSSQTDRQTYAGVSATTRFTNRVEHTIRLGVTAQRYHSINPAPTGTPFDPFGSGPNYLGRTVTITGANGDSVTGQAILDFGGAYPQTLRMTTDRTSVTDQLVYRIADAWTVTGGFRVDREHGVTDTGTPQASTRTNYGAFGELRGRAGRAFVTGGIGVDHNAIYGVAVNPRGSAAVFLRNPSRDGLAGTTRLTANAGSGVKAPAIYEELSSLFALTRGSGQTAIPGVAPIGPSRSRSADVGLEQGLWHERVQLRAAFFDNQFSDLVEFVSAGVLPRLGISPAAAAAAGFGAYVNSSSYWARGLETSADVRAGGWRVSASYTYLAARVTKSFADDVLTPAVNPAFPGVSIGAFDPLVGARPFRRPAHSGNLVVSYAAGPLHAAVSGYFAGKSDDSTFLSDGFFGNSMLLPNHNLAAGYGLVNVDIGWQFDRHVKAFVQIDNLTNGLDEAAFGFPGLSRAVRGGITITAGGDRP